MGARVEGYDVALNGPFCIPQVSTRYLELLHDALTEFLGRGGPTTQVVEVRVVHVAPAAPVLEVKTEAAPDPEREEIDAIKEQITRGRP